MREMTAMATLARSITINAPVEAVFDFAFDIGQFVEGEGRRADRCRHQA